MQEIKLYICDRCGAEFRKKRFCEQHERECKIENCKTCQHAFWVYGCEFNCALQNSGKKCQYEVKKGE